MIPPRKHTPSVVEAMRELLGQVPGNIAGPLPGRVESFDASTRKAEVKPLIRVGYTDEGGARQTDSLPVIPGVPVVFPQSGSGGITFALEPGDIVLLVVAAASLDSWLAGDGAEVDPGDDRRFDLSDAVALPCMHAFGEGAAIGSGTVVYGQVALSEPGAAQNSVRGTDFVAGFDALMTALDTFATAASGDPVATVTATAAAALKLALAPIKTQLDAGLYLTPKVKVP